MSLRADIKKALRVVDRCNISISDDVILALVLAEDRRYNFHLGVDPWAFLRAVYRRISRGNIEGASTIEAQFFRTVSRRRELSLRRKIREMIGATVVSILRPKKRIAMAYMRCAYFGFRRPGIWHAATALGFNLNALSLWEICELVARLKRPVSIGMHEECLQLRRLRERTIWLQQKFEKHQAVPENNVTGMPSLPVAVRQRN
jgi:penicillin-binding protein 1A